MDHISVHNSLGLFQNILDHLPLRVFWKDTDSRYLGCNHLFARDAGFSCPEELIGKTDQDMGWKDQQARYRADDRQVMESEAPRQDYLEPQTTPQGETLWLRTSKFPLRDASQAIIGVVGFYEDVTAQRQADETHQRVARALDLLTKANLALIHSKQEQELFAEISRLCVDAGGYLMAWVGVAEHDAAKTIRPVGQSGFEEGYLDTVQITWSDAPSGQGPTGTALRTGKTIVNQNCRTNPAMAPWREAAIKRGYQSSIALPLAYQGTAWGTLTVYAAAPDAFAVEEVMLLQELANNLTYGVAALRMRAEHDRVVVEQLAQERILRQSFGDSIKAIANTIEARDPYTSGHNARVSQLSIAIARDMGLPEDTVFGIGLAASIHDLGKISIPSELLSKPGRLTEIEYMLVKDHAQSGYDIIKGITFPWSIATMVWQHHERMDGSGYPRGLKGEQILLGSRILAVADVVESMSSNRPYRPALGIAAALHEVERGRGTHYDAAVVDACLGLFRHKGFTFAV